ncbi:MAG: hypothetical protein QM820_56600 [Minicystis sp.]
MIRSTYALVLLVCGGLTLAACGKKDNDASSTGSAAASGSAAAPTATAAATTTASAAPTAAPTDSAAAAPSGTPSAEPTAAPSGAPVVTGPAPQRGIEDCCAALAATATGHRGKSAKNRASRALEVCPQVAALVRQGRATRQQALAQVTSALAGHPVPSSCR